MEIMLSILIPTIPERKDEFSKLYENLSQQILNCYKLHSSLGRVQVLVNDSKKFIEGGITVGKKREYLVKSAQGKYLCFLDDDDTIPNNYVEVLLRLCMLDQDICTFRSIFKCDFYWSIIDMSIHHPENEQATPERIVKRKAWHICPVRSEFAKKYDFEDINNAEDWRWFEQVLTQVTSEAKCDMVLHQYNHSSSHSAVDEIEKT